MTKPVITRSVIHYHAITGKKLVELIDLGEDDMIKVQIYSSDTGLPLNSGWLKAKRKTILDLFVALWPESVAYEFKDKDE